MKMTIAIGCDHIVTDIKLKLKKLLEDKGYKIIDVGTYDQERTHYPIFGQKVGFKLINQDADIGIVICGTGVGISNAVNKVKGIRCSLTKNVLTAELSRIQFDANVIGFGGNIIGTGLMMECIDKFIKTKFDTKNKDLVEYMDSLIKDNKEVSFQNELNKWEKGEYHD